MNNKIVQKLKELPKSPGVYLYRNRLGKVIYVGKAVVLKNRVSSYFQKIEHDPKTTELVKNIANIEWIVVESEFEALILEADLIKRYKPKYNIRFRDDKNYSYLKISGDDYPRISVVHQITDSDAKYAGPFTEASAVKSILKLARHIYPYCSCLLPKDQSCLYYHLKLCPGHGEKYISKSEYAKNIRGILAIFSGKTKKIEQDLKKGMVNASKQQQFEVAAGYRDKLRFIKKIRFSHLFSDRELSADSGLLGLANELELSGIPKRIECFDISNIMGTAAVGSMVVFKNGIASPRDYRRFQIKTVKGANDFQSMAEVLSRRFKLSETKSNDESFSKLPDLVILDGGKGQLSTVLKNVKIPDGVKVVALAKKRETIYSFVLNEEKDLDFSAGPRNNKTQITNNKQVSKSEIPNNNTNSELTRNSKPASTDSGRFKIQNLPQESEAMYLVQRIRDEAHRFAITYHRKVRSKEFFESSLDSIPGVGPKTKKKLITHFGSIKKIKESNVAEISTIVGDKLAKKIKETL